jgi:hypothetical protein
LAGFTQGVLFAGLLAVEWTLLLLLLPHTAELSTEKNYIVLLRQEEQNKYKILRGKYEQYPLQGADVM